MDLISTLNISGSGLTAQRVRLQTISSNLANAKSTGPDGAYRRQVPVVRSESVDPFGKLLDRQLATVEVVDIQEVGDVQQVFDPAHPDADEEGFVEISDVNMMQEMVDMMTAARSYEANANVIDVTHDMAMRAIDIGRR